MTDTALNRYLMQGTSAARAAYTPNPTAPSSGPSNSPTWFETDTGKLYTWNQSTSAWVAVGGGSGGVPYDPGTIVKPTVSAFTKTDASGFTSTFSNLTSGRGVNWSCPTSGSASASKITLNGYTPPAAGTDFEAKLFYASNSPMNASSGGFGFGIGFQDSSGNFNMYGFGNSGTSPPYCFVKSTWSNINSLTAFTRYDNVYNPNGPMWLKLARVGANFVFSVSLDGESWYVEHTESSTTDLGSSLVSVQAVMLQNAFSPQSWTIFDFDHL